MPRKISSSRRAPVSLADIKSHLGHESLGTQAGPRLDGSYRVHVHSRLHRLPDADGVCLKYIIDALVSAGVLANDSREFIPQPPTQSDEKIPSSQPEETIVEFYQIGGSHETPTETTARCINSTAGEWEDGSVKRKDDGE